MWDCIWCLKIWSLSAEPIERYIQVFAFHKLRFFCWIRSREFYCYITTAKFLHCMCSTCFVALRTKYFTFIVQYFTSWLKERCKTPPYDHPVYTITSLLQPYRAYSLTWHSPMLIYMNKRKFFSWEKSSIPAELSLNNNVAAVSLFWNTNMATVMSSEYALFDPNVKSLSHFINLKTLLLKKCDHLVVTTRILWPIGGRINKVPLSTCEVLFYYYWILYSLLFFVY